MTAWMAKYWQTQRIECRWWGDLGMYVPCLKKINNQSKLRRIRQKYTTVQILCFCRKLGFPIQMLIQHIRQLCGSHLSFFTRYSWLFERQQETREVDASKGKGMRRVCKRKDCSMTCRESELRVARGGKHQISPVDGNSPGKFDHFLGC